MGRLQGAGVVARGTEEKTVSCQVRCRFAAVVSLKRSTCELSLTWFEKGTWAPGRKYVLGGDLYWLGLAWLGQAGCAFTSRLVRGEFCILGVRSGSVAAPPVFAFVV